MISAREDTRGFRIAQSAWHDRIEACTDPDELLAATRDFLAKFGPEHLARLPADCRPGRIKGSDDISYWSCRLAQHHQGDPGVPVDAELMQEMLNFFLHAWVRLTQLQHEDDRVLSVLH